MLDTGRFIFHHSDFTFSKPAPQTRISKVENWQSTVVKIVMTGSADDGADWQPHIRSKLRRKALATRFIDTKDSFRIVIVRDMWLTGFDAPACTRCTPTNRCAATDGGRPSLA